MSAPKPWNPHPNARTCAYSGCRDPYRPGMQPLRLNGVRGFWHLKCFDRARDELQRPKIKKGETWRITDARKGDLTLRFTSVGDGWAEGEIIEGKVNFASIDNRLNQKWLGTGTPGDVITIRFSLCTFHEKLDMRKHRRRA